MKQLFKKQANDSMPPLDLEEEDRPRRGSSGPVWISVVSLILIVALLVSSLPTAASSSSTVQTKVVSCQADTQSISSVLYGAGSLVPQEGDDLEVPQGLEIQNYFVKNGHVLSPGDPVAAFDPVEVQTAIVNLQSVIRDLDAAIEEAYKDKPAEYIRTWTEGRVKKIYAEKGVSVADTVYQYGALALLSVDGLMAADLELELPLGQPVTVTLPDGTQVDGTVADFSEGISTITIPDDKGELDELVTVIGEDGQVLGTAPLYIHSMLRIVGSHGIVDSILAKQNKVVPKENNLMLLKDAGCSADYHSLLERRSELEKQLDSLIQLGSDGILRARAGGIVSGVDSSVDYLASPEDQVRSLASPGSARTMEPDPEAPTQPKPTQPEPTVPSTPIEPSIPTLPSTEEEWRELLEQLFPNLPDIPELPEFPDLSDVDLEELLSSIEEQLMEQLQEQLMGQIMEQIQAEMMEQMQAQMMAQIQAMMAQMMGFGGFSMPQAPSYSTYDTTRRIVATTTPLEEMTIDFQVDELDILLLREGMDATVTLNALPGQHFQGTVTNINTYGQNTGGNTKYTVTVRLPREDRMLTGMTASVRITTAVSDPVATLPAAAIQFEGGKSWVYTGYDPKKDTLSGKTQVQTGLSDGQQVELLTAFPGDTTFYYRYADTIEYRFER